MNNIRNSFNLSDIKWRLVSIYNIIFVNYHTYETLLPSINGPLIQLTSCKVKVFAFIKKNQINHKVIE